MWKIVMVLVLTALAILIARLATDVPFTGIHFSSAVVSAPALETPPLMYAGVRG